MKRKLALTAAKWFGKRENREKAKRWVRDFQSRMQQDKDAARTGDASSEHESDQKHQEHHEDRPRSSSQRQSRR